MTPTKEERNFVAYKLRKAATRWSYVWLDDKTLRELTDMEPLKLGKDSTMRECMDSTREIFRHLADLIDPVEGDER